jgi:[acyl-carrier-protein] S-malonyltransferase
MDAAAPLPCALAAILGLAEGEVNAACARHGTWIAIRNGTRHFIVGGAHDKVQRLTDEAHAAGATRAHLLAVHTPAHTPMLEAAVAPFAHVLGRFVHTPMRTPMISGIDASRIANRDGVIGALSRQLATRLDWAACMDAIGEMRPDAVLEIGPGNAIARMFADAWPDVPVRAIDDFRDLAATSAWVSAQRR